MSYPILDAVENPLIYSRQPGAAGEAGNAAEGGGQELGPYGEDPRPTPDYPEPRPTPDPPEPVDPLAPICYYINLYNNDGSELIGTYSALIVCNNWPTFSDDDWNRYTSVSINSYLAYVEKDDYYDCGGSYRPQATCNGIYECGTSSAIFPSGLQKDLSDYAGLSTVPNATTPNVTSGHVLSSETETNYYVVPKSADIIPTITVTYNDGNAEDITSGFNWTPAGALKVSDTYVTITYGGQTTTVNITVKSNGNKPYTPSHKSDSEDVIVIKDNSAEYNPETGAPVEGIGVAMLVVLGAAYVVSKKRK